MLVLRRRAGEAISIGNGIEIEILEIGPSKVKIGIRAPSDISVQRKEMARASEQNRCAAMIPAEARKTLAQELARLFSTKVSKTQSQAADKSFEARYSGHPKTKENLEPA